MGRCDLPDHPVIRNMERTGYPDGEPDAPVCPVCGEYAREFYESDETGDIVGCDCCISRRAAREEYI